MPHTKQDHDSLIKRMAIAAANMFIPVQTLAILFYFVARSLGWNQSGLVQGLGFVLPWLFFPLLFLLPLAWLLRMRVHMACTALTLVTFMALYGQLFWPAPSVSAAGTSFTVMSYNVLFTNQDLDSTLAEIREHAPDVRALHEYTSELAEVMDPELSAIYPYERLQFARGFYSRYPIVDYEAVPLPGTFGNIGQKVVVEVDGERVTIFSVHPTVPDTRVARVPLLDVYLPVAIEQNGAHQRHVETV